MSRILLVASRGECDAERVKRICSSMAPDNIEVPAPDMVVAPGVIGGICNPDRGAPASARALIAGHFFREENGWDQVGGAIPDGSFALCRWSEDTMEVVTDAAGSRSLWYALTEEAFVVSSSMGAIVQMLGGFEFDERVIPWMIATGSLGEYSWDKRIRRCPADSVLTFDRQAWTSDIRSHPVEFKGTSIDLAEALDARFANLRLPDGSVVALSGGVDSRAILAAMPAPDNTPSITWGVIGSECDPQNDIAVAKQVAEKLSSPHCFLPLEENKADIEEVVARFIDVSEGRIDHLGGYSDGFALWKMLYETGVPRIIRGDEGFGWNIAINKTQTRRDLGLTQISDYFIEEQRERLCLEEVTWPTSYHQRPDETLETWRDRLYHLFRFPTVLASLNDIKGGYLEIINPLLARDLIRAARQLPDRERTEKQAFREWAKNLGPKLPYARANGTMRIGELLKNSRFADMVERDVGPTPALPPQFRSFVISELKRSLAFGSNTTGMTAWLRKKLPKSVKARFRATKGDRKLSMEPAVLALRALIIARMHRTLSAYGAGQAG